MHRRLNVGHKCRDAERHRRCWQPTPEPQTFRPRRECGMSDHYDLDSGYQTQRSPARSGVTARGRQTTRLRPSFLRATIAASSTVTLRDTPQRARQSLAPQLSPNCPRNSTPTRYRCSSSCSRYTERIGLISSDEHFQLAGARSGGVAGRPTQQPGRRRGRGRHLVN